MSELTVNVRGLSGQFDITLPEGATVADLKADERVNDGLSVLSGGQPLPDSAPLSDEQVVVTTAPEAKHGLVA